MRSNYTQNRNVVKSEARKSWNGLRDGHSSRLRMESMRDVVFSEPWLYVVLGSGPSTGFPDREEGIEKKRSYFTPQDTFY